jgi:hypothetical protein
MKFFASLSPLFRFQTLRIDRGAFVRLGETVSLGNPEIKGLRANDFTENTESVVPVFPPERT